MVLKHNFFDKKNQLLTINNFRIRQFNNNYQNLEFCDKIENKIQFLDSKSCLVILIRSPERRINNFIVLKYIADSLYRCLVNNAVRDCKTS